MPRRLLNPPKCGAYLSNYCNLQLKSLLHLGQNVITFRTLLHLGQNVITFRTLLHLGSFITFRPSTPGWGTSNNWLYGPELKASPERGTLFTVPEYERPGYSQDEVYESTVKGWENLSFILSILITGL